MKRIIIFIIVLVILTIVGLFAKRRYYDPKHKLALVDKQIAKFINNDEFKEGDIIFQTSLSRQSKAIQIATHSEFSHCGLIYKNGKDYFVYEAVEPVKLTPLNKWIAHGQDGHFVTKRLIEANKVLTDSTLHKMKVIEDRFKNKHYDIYFEWSNDRIYCSELIWKVYKEATGLEVGKLQQLKEFDLTSEAVKAKMKERYGEKIPLEEIVISPSSIYNSDILKTVISN